MRIQLKLSPATSIVPYDYPYQIGRLIHKWLGRDNDFHDAISLYSFGQLQGGIGTVEGIKFPYGATLNISAWDDSFINRIIANMKHSDEFVGGMRLQVVNAITMPDFQNRVLLRLESPMLLKANQPGGGTQFLTFQHGEIANQALTNTVLRKLKEAGLGDYEGKISLAFRPDRNSKTKLIDIKGIQSRASMCAIYVSAPVEVMKFIWLTGVGNGTGMGFGAIK